MPIVVAGRTVRLPPSATPETAPWVWEDRAAPVDRWEPDRPAVLRCLLVGGVRCLPRAFLRFFAKLVCQSLRSLLGQYADAVFY